MMRVRKAYIQETGGPDVIRWRDTELPPPGPGQALVRHEAVGINFIDTYHRSGLYPIELPGTLGLEAAGVVEAVGDGAGSIRQGDRVAMFGPSRAAYADAQVVGVDELFVLPEGVDARVAAAILLKGATAEMLVERVAPVESGEWALVHAAAGGVGQLLVQWLVARGVRVIGTAGTSGKRDIVAKLGAEHVLDAHDNDIAKQVRGITGGKGVRASYDGVGRATWETSLASTGRRGIIASFGNASGPVTGINLGALASAGSLFVSRPTLFDYYREPAERVQGAQKLWAMVLDGMLEVEIGQTYPLEDAERAHRDLEGRDTTGSGLLIP